MSGYTVFWRWQDDLCVQFFGGKREVEQWLATEREQDGGLGLRDVMNNGLRSSKYDEIEEFWNKRHCSFPEESFLVISGTPVEMVVKERVLSYAFRS